MGYGIEGGSLVKVMIVFDEFEELDEFAVHLFAFVFVVGGCGCGCGCSCGCSCGCGGGTTILLGRRIRSGTDFVSRSNVSFNAFISF